MFAVVVCSLILSASLAAADKPATVVPLKLQQIISREDPLFDCARASLTIGRDGMVYLTSAGHDSGYILRVSRDGQDKLGGASVPAIHNATADAASLIAAASGVGGIFVIIALCLAVSGAAVHFRAEER